LESHEYTNPLSSKKKADGLPPKSSDGEWTSELANRSPVAMAENHEEAGSVQPEVDRVRRSVVSGAVPVWVSPRALMPDGTVLFHKARRSR
jgi:hypothetical protein